LSNRRDKVDRGRDFEEKRKAEKKFNQITNIKKARNRIANFSLLKKKLKKRKNANRSTINRNIKLSKRIAKYENAFINEKEFLIQKCKKDIVVKR
jgi:predicted amidophosphoribosyltransferase